MCVDPGKSIAAWRAIFYVMLIYCAAFLLLRLTDILPAQNHSGKNHIADFFFPLYEMEKQIRPFLPKNF